MVKRINFIEGLANTLGAMANGNPYRDDVFKSNVGDIIIDTCVAYDTKEWETGIKKGKWIVVQQYKNRKLAEKGHNKWVKKMTGNPNLPLEDIDLWGLNKLKEKGC